MVRNALMMGVILALFAPAAIAQDDMMRETTAFGPAAGDWELTLGGGGSSDQDLSSTNANFDGSLGYFFTEAWMVGLRQSVDFNDIGGSDLSGSTRAVLDYHFDMDRLRPFLGVSAGGVYGDGVSDSGTAGLEGGLKWYAREKTFIFGRLEYQWLFDSGDEVDDNFEDGQFIYTFGIGFNF